MPIQKTVRIIFLAMVILVELFLTFASTFYVPWHSMSFLVITSASVISIAAILYYVLEVDKRSLNLVL